LSEFLKTVSSQRIANTRRVAAAVRSIRFTGPDRIDHTTWVKADASERNRQQKGRQLLCRKFPLQGCIRSWHLQLASCFDLSVPGRGPGVETQRAPRGTEFDRHAPKATPRRPRPNAPSCRDCDAADERPRGGACFPGLSPSLCCAPRCVRAVPTPNGAVAVHRLQARQAAYHGID
jgi:hypothetical protein